MQLVRHLKGVFETKDVCCVSLESFAGSGQELVRHGPVSTTEGAGLCSSVLPSTSSIVSS